MRSSGTCTTTAARTLLMINIMRDDDDADADGWCGTWYVHGIQYTGALGRRFEIEIFDVIFINISSFLPISYL